MASKKATQKKNPHHTDEGIYIVIGLLSRDTAQQAVTTISMKLMQSSCPVSLTWTYQYVNYNQK